MSPFLPVAVDLDIEIMNDTPAQDGHKEIRRLAAQPNRFVVGFVRPGGAVIRSVDSELSIGAEFLIGRVHVHRRSDASTGNGRSESGRRWETSLSGHSVMPPSASAGGRS